MNKINKLFIFLILTLIFVSKVNAQQLDVSLSPPQVEILIKENTSLLKAFDFKNTGDPGVFSANVVSFEPIGNNGSRIIKDKAEGPVRFSLENSNLDFEQKFALKNNQSQQFLLKVRTIENAPEGDYYYMLTISSEPPVTQNTATRSRASIAANILISISNSGMTNREAKVGLFSIIPQYKLSIFGKTVSLVDTEAELPVVLTIANVGRNLIVPNAGLTLRGPYVTTTRVEFIPLNILKNSERLLIKEIPDECIRCKIPVSAVFKGFFLGKYYLTAEIELVGTNKKLYETIEFWGIPVKLVMALSLIIVALLIYVWFSTKKRYKK